MKLGGWMRLWVVFSVIVGLMALGVVALSMPTEGQIKSDWYYAGTDAIAKVIGDFEKQLVFGSRVRDELERERMAKVVPGDPPVNFAESGVKMLEEYDAEQPVQKLSWIQIATLVRPINTTYREKLANLPAAQRTLVLQGLGTWAAICASVLLLGWSLRWIYRGFRRPV